MPRPRIFRNIGGQWAERSWDQVRETVWRNHVKIGKSRQEALVAEVGKSEGQFRAKALSRVQQLS